MDLRLVSLDTATPVVGEGTVIEQPCVIGAKGAAAAEGVVVIGAGCVIRAFTTIYAGAKLGDRVRTGQGATIREDNVIGDDSSIGTNTVLEPGNRIGERVRIHTGCFLELVTVEDDVFIGPNVVFADDPHPPCPRYAECVGGATVGRGARIGANATILPGVHIGAGALVAAGTIVATDVPDGSVFAGEHGRARKRVDELVCRAGFYKRPYEWTAGL